MQETTPQVTPMAQGQAVQTPASTSAPTDKKYAGFWIRFLAMLIDGIILGIINSLFFKAQTNTFNTDGGMSMASNVNPLGMIVQIVYVVAFWTTLSATPGKMALGLMVVDEQGNKLTWQKAALRYVGYFVSSITLGIGYLMVAFDKNKQGLHDKIAKTYVIRKQK